MPASGSTIRAKAVATGRFGSTMSIEANGSAATTSKRTARDGSFCVNDRASRQTSNKFAGICLVWTELFARAAAGNPPGTVFLRETFVSLQMPGNCTGRRVFSPETHASCTEVPNMLTITPRAARVSIPISIMFRRSGEEDWLAGKVVNLSESGRAVRSDGAATRHAGRGAPVAAHAGRLASPRVSRSARRKSCEHPTSGVTAVRFDECRFLLE